MEQQLSNNQKTLSQTEDFTTMQQQEHFPIMNGWENQYKKVEQLGSGGNANVFKALNKEEQLSAIKKTQNSINPTKIQNSTFCQEVKNLKILQEGEHPNILILYNYWLQQKKLKKTSHDNIIVNSNNNIERSPTINKKRKLSQDTNDNISQSQSQIGSQQRVYGFIQTEYCENNLNEYILSRNKEISNNNNKQEIFSQQAGKIALQIIQGLKYIHSKKIVHLDIKPQNIFLKNNNQQVKIGDFGSAMNFEEFQIQMKKQQKTKILYTQMYAHPGFLSFISPQKHKQLQGKEVNPQEYDIYSLGILLFQLFNPVSTNMEMMELIKAYKNSENDVNKCLNSQVSIILRDILSLKSFPSLQEIEEILIQQFGKIETKQEQNCQKLQKYNNKNNNKILTNNYQEIDILTEFQEQDIEFILFDEKTQKEFDDMPNLSHMKKQTSNESSECGYYTNNLNKDMSIFDNYSMEIIKIELDKTGSNVF